MATPAHTYVQYFVPIDGDVEDHPNVFLVRKPQRSITLADIEGSFPLPGTYVFRAKAAFGKTHGACAICRFAALSTDVSLAVHDITLHSPAIAHVQFGSISMDRTIPCQTSTAKRY